VKLGVLNLPQNLGDLILSWHGHGNDHLSTYGTPG
jgi:hypothetical protein